MNDERNLLFPDNASGEISVTLTNDMMFHCVMQHSNEALKHLACSVKGFRYEDVQDVTLLNTIDYGEINPKEIILDTRILLKNNNILNIELQMYTETFWTERSLLYLCRSFDTLNGGDDYSQLKETTQVCITDQDFFKNCDKEFFARFGFINTKYYYPYSTLWSIFVLNLNRIDLATEKDKENNLDLWARMFKATTWEEFHELAKEFPIAREVARIMYAINADVHERSKFEAHRRYLEDKITTENELARLRLSSEKKDQTIAIITADRDQAIVDRNQAVADRDQAVADRNQAVATIEHLKERIKELENNKKS